MPEVNVLYNVMQGTNLTVQKVKQHVKILQGAVYKVRSSSITNHAKTVLVVYAMFDGWEKLLKLCKDKNI